ncbi:ABC transporter permease subunit [Proteiniclasticum sp. SCR006]|uniref:ABC transporter permease subunit n=1 Tax=Proteiniclasticum aestuarii TaxID=2817862 RepID=A0A939KG85_9CLOT|nr:ABC transporter permease subunit [Proteiniclasticum aestuarii]
MAKYSKVLYDYIGREYERKNLYLKEVALLQDKIAHASQSEKQTLKNQLKELISKKDSHPYLLKLKEYEEREKKFLEELKAKSSAHKETLDKSLSKEVAELELALYVSKLKEAFYKDYVQLTYDAEFGYREAVIQMKLLPEVIEKTMRLEDELRKALTLKAEGDKEAIGKEIAQFKAEQKALYDTRSEELKKKRNDGLISEKALKNGMKELKKNYKYAVRVKEFEDPDKMKKELIKSRRFELKDFIKVSRRIVNADIADARRNTPVEVMKTQPVNTAIGALFPGVGQLLNKQPVKAALFFLGLVFIYAIAIPYALGYGNYQGSGIAGLISLAEGGRRIDKSLIFMIEGIIAIVLLLFAAGIYIANYKDVKGTEKNVMKGIRPKNWFETKQSIEEEGFPYLVSIPALIVIAFIVLVPIFTAILLSFTGMDPKNQSKFPWVGFGNYKLIALGEGLAGSVFWQILAWTVIWTLLATTLAIFIGFGLALLANNPRIKGKGILRMIYLLPWAVPAFITIMFFSIMFSSTGALTEIIENVFGVLIDFKNDTFWSRFILIMLQGWLGSSYVFLLSTGVLQAIPEDLYEAADIDGANSWQKIRKITLPMVLFQTAPLLVNQYTFNFNNFSIIYLFNGGGPFNPSVYGNLAGSSDILISYIYKLTMDNQYQAIGAAISIVISLGLMIFAFIGYKNSKAFKEERL